MLLKIIRTHFDFVGESHTSQSYERDVQNIAGTLFFGGEKNQCQKRIKAETQHKIEMTSCETKILDGLMYYYTPCT